MQIIKLKKGYAIRFYDTNGKQKYLSGFKTKSEARQTAEEYKKNQVHAVDREINVEEYLLKWFDDYVELSVAERTRQRYAELIILHVIPNLGHYMLDKLKPAHISSFYSAKITSGELSSTTVLQIHRILSEAFKHAVSSEYLNNSPCFSVKAPKKADTEIIIPSDKELTMILQEVKDTEYFMPFFLCSITGMRLSEIAGLQVENIDIVRKTINVRWNYQRIRGVYQLCKLKTKSSKRSIFLLSGTENEIIKYIKQKKINKVKCISYENSNFFLTHGDGQPFQSETLSKKFKKVIRKLNLNDDMSFKSLRHHHATYLLKNNIHPKIVSERLGHSSINITLDTYTHVIPSMQEKALVNIDTNIFKVENKSL